MLKFEFALTEYNSVCFTWWNALSSKRGTLADGASGIKITTASRNFFAKLVDAQPVAVEFVGFCI